MQLETKVPTLETCIRARDNGYPQGKSYFVWINVQVNVPEGRWDVVPRFTLADYRYLFGFTGKGIDAPMLQEVLEEVADLNKGGVEISVEKWSMSPTEDGSACSLWKHEIWEDEIHVHRAIITSLTLPMPEGRGFFGSRLMTSLSPKHERSARPHVP